MTLRRQLEAAVAHHQAGRLAEAEALYNEILAQQSDHADAMHLLGVAAGQTGRLDLAEDLMRRAIRIKPNLAQAHNNLAFVLAAKGRHDDAIVLYRRAIEITPDLADAHNNLCFALNSKKQFEAAIAVGRQAVRINPQFAEAHLNLGNALQGNGQLDDAINCYRQAIQLKPDFAEAHTNLGNALTSIGRHQEAIAANRQAIQLKPNLAEAHFNLAIALEHNKQYEEAIVANHEAIRLKPDYAEAYSNLGQIQSDLGQLNEAIAANRQAISLSPNLPEPHLNLAICLLTQKNFEQAWPEYEWRWKCKEFPSPQRNFPQPQWDGSPLESRTILLHTEQGLGDAIQFIRYAPLVARRGGKIIIECQPELARLFQTMPGEFQIISRGQSLPPFDLHSPLLSLPLVFKTTLDNLPQTVPYLHANVEDSKKWKHRLAGDSQKLNVGLVWAGNPGHENDRNRSMKLASLSALAQVPGIRFISLQKGDAAVESKTPPPGMELIDWTNELNDFAETAALIANLALVIAVDTAVVHLAGAMAKPVWTLLPFVPDWRWMLEQEDTPWYPSMRLFRQPSQGNWDSVIKRITTALSDWEAAHRSPR
jgi:tetratricopeptide (TPR) repeat protein